MTRILRRKTDERRALRVGVVALLALVAVACGGDENEAATTTATSASSNESSTTTSNESSTTTQGPVTTVGTDGTLPPLESGYPSEPIVMVLPSPGSTTERIGRAYVDFGTSDHSPVPVLVEAIQGSTDESAFQVVSDENVADGYLVSLITNHSVIGTLTGATPFDFQDIQGLATIASIPFVIAVPVDSPFVDFSDLVSAAQQDASAIAASLGAPAGSLHHISLIRMNEIIGGTGDFAVIPHDTGPDGNLTLLGGGADIGMGTLSGYLQDVEAGNLRLLASFGAERSPTAPDTPTLQELGYDLVSDNQFRLVTGSSVSPEKVQWLSDLFGRAWEAPELQQLLTETGWDLVYLDAVDTQNQLEELRVESDRILTELGLK